MAKLKLKVFNPELVIADPEKRSAILMCAVCENVEFEVTIEPSYNNNPAMAKGLGGENRRVMFCPFCGGEKLSEV